MDFIQHTIRNRHGLNCCGDPTLHRCPAWCSTLLCCFWCKHSPEVCLVLKSTAGSSSRLFLQQDPRFSFDLHPAKVIATVPQGEEFAKRQQSEQQRFLVNPSLAAYRCAMEIHEPVSCLQATCSSRRANTGLYLNTICMTSRCTAAPQGSAGLTAASKVSWIIINSGNAFHNTHNGTLALKWGSTLSGSSGSPTQTVNGAEGTGVSRRVSNVKWWRLVCRGAGILQRIHLKTPHHMQ